MSRAEKWIAGIFASIVAAGVPAGISAYAALAAAQERNSTRIEALVGEQEYQRDRIDDTLHNVARICERLGVQDCRSGR